MKTIHKNRGLVNGLLFAGAAIGIGILLYFTSKPLFLDPTLRFFLSLALPIVFMSRASLEKRKELGGFINFTEAVQPAYITLIIGSMLFGIFQFILMNSDYELLEIQRSIAIESLESISTLANLSEENIAELRTLKPEDYKPTFRAFMLGTSKNFILGFIIAVIIALIVKRKNLASE